GNLRARARMAILYFIANTEDRVVMGTGNKSEALTGYFSKWGDGGVDFLPIGDLYKTQVKEMARYVGVPPEIVEKVPTAGLWPGHRRGTRSRGRKGRRPARSGAVCGADTPRGSCGLR